MSEPEFKKLLDEPLSVINTGLERFAQDLEQQGVKVVHVDWAPPAGGNSEFVKLLSRLEMLSHDREFATKRIEDELTTVIWAPYGYRNQTKGLTVSG